MGKSEVRTVVIRRRMTAALLALTTAAMTLSVWLLAAHAHLRETRSAGDLLARALDRDRGRSPGGIATLALLMPVFANVMIFVPWGFFAFLVFDRPPRIRPASYAMTVTAGVAFALALSMWQSYFPVRLTAPSDVVANAAGAAIGAALGHLRKAVRIRFET